MHQVKLKISSFIILLCAISFPVYASYDVGSGIGQKDDVGDVKFASEDDLIGFDSFYDPKVDYALFTGRVSDRDATSNILKIRSDNKNTKFFRTGDRALFNVVGHKNREKCESFVRSVEEGYFVIYVKDINVCWDADDYFRRGSLLSFKSAMLEKRVQEASLHRVLLLKRRKAFFKQLNGINHFVWSYEQQKVKLASEYDKQIVELEKKKRKAIDLLLIKKKDKIRLQKELAFSLDEIDKDLDFYRIEKNELYSDRWNKDHDLGLPVSKRPQAFKSKSGKY